MKYKKCPRCNLNYMVETQSFCKICQAEMSGKSTIFDPVEWDFCPFCEKNRLENGEEICKKCQEKRQKNSCFDEM
ncbi:MAG: hypothetical protein E7344_00970 [Clostridiales bacterium]|nr:hypothetical protein [Clostridiales bacterium]